MQRLVAHCSADPLVLALTIMNTQRRVVPALPGIQRTLRPHLSPPEGELQQLGGGLHLDPTETYTIALPAHAGVRTCSEILLYQMYDVHRRNATHECQL